MNDKVLGEAMKDLHGYDPTEEDAQVQPGAPTWLLRRRLESPLRDEDWPAVSRDAGETDDRALLADVAFNRHSMNDGHHVGPSDTGGVAVGTDNIEVRLVQGIDVDALKRTLSAATRATIGLDMSRGLPGDWEDCPAYKAHIMECQARFKKDKNASFPEFTCPEGHSDHDASYQGLVESGDWEEMLKGGLQTALETQVIVFAVSGVSRTCTHQLVRSRRAAFHQQSQRASYMGDMPEVRCPESVYRNPRAFQAFCELTLKSWETYRICCEEDISYQDSRFALLEGTTNFILLEYPIREFLNVYAYRACSMFQWEIVEVMRKAKQALVEAHPFMEPYVKISCERTGPAVISTGRQLPVVRDGRLVGEPQTTTVEHHCTFQGWEDVEGQCDFPWAKQEARTFKPEHHRISRSKS